MFSCVAVSLSIGDRNKKRYFGSEGMYLAALPMCVSKDPFERESPINQPADKFLTDVTEVFSSSQSHHRSQKQSKVSVTKSITKDSECNHPAASIIICNTNTEEEE